MPEYQHRSEMPASAAEVYAWHARPGALERLVPPWMGVKVFRREGGVDDGGTVLLELSVGPYRTRWLARHEEAIANRQFIDEQIEGPFAKWRHAHRFLPGDADRSQLEDHVHFRVPGGGLGHKLATPFVLRELGRAFPWRHARTRMDLRRHRAAALAPMRIVVSGATGLVGEALVAFLRTGGHRVDRLVRGEPAPGSTDIRWDPRQPGEAGLDPAAIDGADAVIHLAGENIAARWTPAKMAAILDSRKGSTRLLAETIARLPARPKVFISASAVGYYGDRGDEVVDETDRTAGTGFLSEVCQAWEMAAFPARDAGVRTVNMRFGVVLTPRGGALAKMLPPFRLGLGGVVGSGAQWLSWIGLDDLLGAFLHVLKEPSLEGPVNATSPQPVTNRDFTRALGAALGRPTPFPLPGGVVLTLFGDMGRAMLLEGQRVVPGKLQESGFRFETPLLPDALAWELGNATP